MFDFFFRNSACDVFVLLLIVFWAVFHLNDLTKFDYVTVVSQYLRLTSLVSVSLLVTNQRTNGPVNAHLRSAIFTKYLFKKFALYGAPPTNQNKGLGQKSTKL